MTPIDFKESNTTFVGSDDTGDLPVIRIVNTENNVIGHCSKWKMTPDEWLDIKLNDYCLWLIVYGQGIPPMSLHGEKPFNLVK